MSRREQHRTPGVCKVVLGVLVCAGLGALGCARSRPANQPDERAAADAASLYNDSFATSAGTQMVAALDTLANLEDAQIRISAVIAQALCIGAALWVESHDSCPTPDDIVAQHMIDTSVHAQDAWDHPYRITCGGDDPDADAQPVVTSAGPDGVFGTPDDIVAGQKPQPKP